MTSFGQSNSKVYSFSHWVSGGAIVVRSEISGAAGGEWGADLYMLSSLQKRLGVQMDIQI